MTGDQAEGPAPVPRFELNQQDIELLELAVNWAVMGHRVNPAGGQLLDDLLDMRRRLRRWYAIRVEWETTSREWDTDSPF